MEYLKGMNKYCTFSISSGFLVSCLLLAGCGGGEGGNGATTTSNPSSTTLPQRLTSNNLTDIDMLARASNPAPTVSNDKNTLTFTHSGSDVNSNLHYQFFINTDNNPNTGFSFFNEVWDDAGTDYIIQDGSLYKSTSNDSSWSWEASGSVNNYVTSPTSIAVTLNQNLLDGLAPQIRIGFIIRDENWDVVSIWPSASQMALVSLDVTPPTDTVAPVISLNGSQNLTIQKGSTYTELGANALDNFDGDISDKIEVSSNLDTTSLGVYQITYSVSDLAGNQSSEVRTITVSENQTNGIVIDGSIHDWNDIPVHSTSDVGTIKITDSTTNLFILIEGYQPLGANTQIFIDSDNKTTTGFRFFGEVWFDGGANYMIENNLLSRSLATNRWTWDYDYSPISYIKSNNIIEVAIPKSSMKSTGELEATINVGFVNRTADWEIESVLPESGMQPHKLKAINDFEMISGFCENIWETDGTAENTQESQLNIHATSGRSWSNIWEKKDNFIYGLLHIENTVGNDIAIYKFNSLSDIKLLLPLSVVRSEPINNGKISAMKFVGDDLYFLFENELWRTDGTGSGSLRLKTFEGVATLFTTSNEVYVYEQMTYGSSYKLWKLENNEILTEVAAYNDDDSYVISTYEDKLYTAKKDDSGKYIVVEHDAGIETELSPSFTNKPRLSSTNGAFYISDVQTNAANTPHYFWKLNQTSNVFEKVTRNSRTAIGSVTSRFEGISLVHGNEFVIQNGQAFINPPTASLFRVLNSEDREEILAPNRITHQYQNGSLYLTTTNYGTTTTSTRPIPINNELFVINDNSGIPKKLATCEIPE